MATAPTVSSTDDFNMDAEALIRSGLRGLEVYGSGVDPTPEDLADCLISLNLMVKSLITRPNYFIWKWRTLQIPLINGQSQYQIGPASAQPRPLKLNQAFLRDQTGNDTELMIVSEQDYNRLGDKTAPGTPNQLFYSPKLGNGVITVYNQPANSPQTLFVQVQTQVFDFNALTDLPDFPPEALRMIKWNFMDEIALDYGAKLSTTQIVAAKAEKYLKDFEDYNQEEASQFFYPSGRRS